MTNYIHHNLQYTITYIQCNVLDLIFLVNIIIRVKCVDREEVFVLP